MLEFETLEAAEAHLIAAGLKPVGVADWLRADDGADGVTRSRSTATCDIVSRSFGASLAHAGIKRPNRR